jgi:hypothetical protein
MNARVRNAAVGVVAMCVLATLSWFIFRGYLTADMMVYFLSFKWCF